MFIGMEPTKNLTAGELVSELLIYGGLMIIYTLVVLGYLSNHVYVLYKNDTLLYTLTALFLILGQGLLMENLATYIREKIEVE
ncbi:MAG: hypothetical protein B6U97_04620 [Candidatus Altiarchaeales archaeon ex4484_96]|nr:MAG: hypothetical protein B6U97_04620 [Candidatus Altiarchaeales archaeon ex4484_96]